MGGGSSFAGLARLTLAVFFIMLQSAAAGEQPAKPTVLATLFPQYDFARRIAGDLAEVRLLLPPGAESHSFEPSPSDMKAIAAADVFIYTGEHMEPWAKRLADSAAARVVDASRGIALRPGQDAAGEHGHDDDDDGEHEHADEAHFHAFDPHIWLDPVFAGIMVENIATAMIEADPANAEAYRRNAGSLREEIALLDAGFRERIAPLPRRTLVFGERFAFAYFFARYGLEEVGAYKSCAPGAEPGLKAVIATIEYVKRNGVRYIYLESMATGRISAVVGRETGAEILTVDSLHTLSAEQMARGVGYVDVMRRNMDAFARGLE